MSAAALYSIGITCGLIDRHNDAHARRWVELLHELIGIDREKPAHISEERTSFFVERCLPSQPEGPRRARALLERRKSNGLRHIVATRRGDEPDALLGQAEGPN